MTKRKITDGGFLVFCFLLLAGPSLPATSLNDFAVLKISAHDQSAVIKTAAGKLQILKPGDKIGENGLVLEIDAGRIVIEENKAGAKESIILYFENGRQRIERVSTTGSQTPTLHLP